MLFLKKFILCLVPLVILGIVIYYTEPPKSWPQATLTQILSFFIPLLLSLTFFVNLILSYLPHSFIWALGTMMLIVLWSIGLFNYVSVPITLAITIGAFKFFPKIRYPRWKIFRLTKEANIPKLTPKR